MTSAIHPAPTSIPSEIQLSALLRGAAISRLDTLGWIQVTGPDRVRWLNGMATNNVQQLADGAGNYNFFLNAQGRIQGDGYTFSRPGTLLIETQASQIATLIPYLDHYIIMDDVELKDITGTWSGLTVIGPQSAELLSQLGLDIAELKPLELRETSWSGSKISTIHTYSPLVPRYEIWADEATIDKLFQTLQTAGATLATAESLDSLRVLEGTPRYGADIRDRDLPQETDQARALHFAKGCYLGQEIVERIRSRGNVHRTLHAFRLEGNLPTASVILEAAGKPAGELTTVAAIPFEGKQLQLALGYIRREALERGGPVAYPGGTAIPISSPFRTDEANTSPQASESSERK
jgi:aminomethyltransferase